jgi:hypothetical protein
LICKSEHYKALATQAVGSKSALLLFDEGRDRLNRRMLSMSLVESKDFVPDMALEGKDVEGPSYTETA